MPENRRLEIEKSRANQAFNDVKNIKDEAFSKKYKSLVKKTPARIKNCGLNETLAFIFSKQNNKPYFKKLYEQLNQRLQSSGYLTSSTEELMLQLIKMDKSLYRSVTNETLAYLTWIKRFTEGMIEGEDNED